ncbi:TIGR03545 family protein [Thalassomonas sp. M1454]|uniref:TIGR03545 family protein n=1 Tax=Thalassomonas sp. M1454 TaxID=2594477 RepID=UPI0011807B23|nr:TIGR03545 family protein [Thalassomonas sp. M1454]TRX54556.1 TIGR03545 family protein [Thalassomonas sp. M1454]
MAKFFRWQGIAGFILTVAAVLAVLLVLAPTLVKISIEEGAGWYNGAEVNVGDVDIQWSPLVVKVNNLQATDNKKPSNNFVEFEQASAGVDIWQYMFGRVLIEELEIVGLAFDTERSSAGEVYRDADTSIVKASAQSIEQKMPAIEDQLPDVKDILDDSNLLTVKASKQLEQSYKQEKQKLKALQQKIPNKARLKDYEARVKKLTKTKIKSVSDVTRLQQELDSLKKQFKQDKALIKQSKQQLKASKTILAKAVKEVKNAPDADWQQLESKYQLDKVDNADFAHILFGESARGYYQTASDIYQKVKPYLDDSKEQKQQQKQAVEQSLAHGRFIHFIDENPLPPWLVKKAHLQVNLAQGNFDINIIELTSEHWHRNKPTLINITTKQLLKGGDAKLTSQVFKSKSDVDVKGDWLFSHVPVTDVKLRDNKNLALTLDSADITGVGQFSFAGQNISSINDVNVAQTKFTGSSDSSIGRSLVSAINEVNKFNLDVEVSGDINSPDYKVKSDLDNIIGRAINKQLQKKLTDFQNKLQSGLNQKVAKALKINDSEAAELADIESLLTDTDKALNKLLKSKLADSKKDELEDKLKKKLKGLLG